MFFIDICFYEDACLKYFSSSSASAIVEYVLYQKLNGHRFHELQFSHLRFGTANSVPFVALSEYWTGMHREFQKFELDCGSHCSFVF